MSNGKKSLIVLLAIASVAPGVIAFTPSVVNDLDVDFVSAPAITSIDMWEQSAGLFGPSRLNMEVPVGNTYTFYLGGNYSDAGVDHWADAKIELMAWYDNGAVGIASMPPDGTWSVDDRRTQQFRLTYNVGTGIAAMAYPAGVVHEFEIHSWWEDPNVYGGASNMWHRLYINVTFGPQTYVADGNGFIFGASGDILDNNFLLDAYSWDFNFTIYDATTPSLQESAYEEFGISPFVDITAYGNPSASAPPGTANVIMSPDLQFTYSANTDYWVNVSIGDLLYNGVGPMYIPASNVEVRNINTWANADSDIPDWTYIPGEGVDISAWGHAGPTVPLPPVRNGTTSAARVSDYTWFKYGVYPDFTNLNFRISIPMVPEGLYWTIVTVTIESLDGASAMETSSQLRVYAQFPHIFDIDMWEQSDPSQTSVMNTEVEHTNTYTFYLESNYTIGGIDNWMNSEIELTSWFDQGMMGWLSIPPDTGWSSPTERHRQFRLYYNVNNDTAWMDYPVGSPFEFQIHSWFADPVTVNVDHHRLYINVTFSDMAYLADGDGFIFGSSIDILDLMMSLLDTNSWDFNYSIYDMSFPSAREEAFEEFGIKDPGFNIDLDAGWNLVSFPLIQADTSVEVVLNSIDGYWDMVQYYDASDAADPWKTYSTFKPVQLNDLADLDHTMGFWLHVTSPVTLTVSGSRPVSTNILLKAGWNMVGYPTSEDNMTVSDATWGTGVINVMVFNPADPYNLIEVGPGYIMKPGEGYWMRVIADTVWTVDY